MEALDIEKYIEDSFVLGLRSMFFADDKFTFTIDPLTSKIGITSSKPKEASLGKPHAYISDITYRIDPMSLNSGYKGDIINEDGVSIGEERVIKLAFSLAIRVLAPTSSQSKNFANRIVNWLAIRGINFFESSLQLMINGVRKSPGGSIKLTENAELFSDTIGIDGQAVITTSITDIDLSGILETIILSYKLDDQI